MRKSSHFSLRVFSFFCVNLRKFFTHIFLRYAYFVNSEQIKKMAKMWTFYVIFSKVIIFSNFNNENNLFFTLTNN